MRKKESPEQQQFGTLFHQAFHQHIDVSRLAQFLHKIGCGSEKQLNKFIDFSLALHNFCIKLAAARKNN